LKSAEPTRPDRSTRRGTVSPSRRTAPLLLATATAALTGHAARAANTAATLTTGAALDVGSDWSTGTVPGVTNDAVIGATYPSAAATLYFNSSTAAAQAFGSLDVANGNAITIENSVPNTASGAVTLTLGGSSSLGNGYAPSVGGTAADLLYVAAGSSLTYQTSSLSTASYGILNLALGQSGTFDVAGTATINTSVTGTGFALIKTGVGTLVMGVSSSYSGGTNISGGVLQASSTNNIGGGPTNISGGTYRQTANLSSARTFTFGAAGGQIDESSGFTFTSTGLFTGPGAFTFDSLTTTSTTGVPDSGSMNLTGTVNFAGALTVNAGVLAFNGSSSYGGTTTLNRSTFILGAAANLSSAALTINNATLSLLPGQSKSTTVASTTLGTGASNLSIGAFNSSTPTASLGLGTITRSTATTADIVLPSTGSVTTTNVNGTASGAILGGYLTVNGGASWATSTAGTIGALATFGSTYGSATSATDFDTGGASGTLTAVNTLRFSSGGATVTPGTALAVASGGILVTPSVGGSQSVIAGGTLTSGGTELFLHQFDTSSTLLVTSTLIDGSAGATSLVKTGPGTAILDSSNAYTGTTYINAGALQIGNGDTKGTFGTGPVVVNGTLAVNRTDASGYSLAIPLSGIGGVSQLGTGTLIIDAADTLTGSSSVASGTTMQIGNNDAVGALGTGPVVNAGTVVISRSDTYALANVISGAGVLAMNGSGTLIAGPVNGTSSTFTGGTVINAGVVQTSNTSYLGSGAITINGGAFRETGNLSSGRGYAVNLANSTIDVSSGATFNTNSSSVVSGTGALNLNATSAADTGTLALTGNNTYAGPTNVVAGTLRANTAAGSGSATGNGAVNVPVGGTLGGGGVILNTAGPVTVAGTITAGLTSGLVGTLTTNAQVWNGSGSFIAKYTSATPATGTFDQLKMTGLTINATAGVPFSIALSNLSTGVVLTNGTSVVLADDTDPTAANPFNVSGGTQFASLAALQAALVLNTGTGVTAPGGYAVQLDTQQDGSGGFDLILDDVVAATPEPTSLMLLGGAVAPLAIRRQRRRCTGHEARLRFNDHGDFQ
jgi:autotransporter-associated beta strand protein